jgi:hypothetical protein
MNEIICPHCNKAFKIDEAGYANILKQVRNGEFEKQLHERLELVEKDKQYALQLAEGKLSSELQKASAAKESEIQELKSIIGKNEMVQQMAVFEALKTIEKERDELAYSLKRIQQENETATKLADAKYMREFQEVNAQKEKEIQELKAKLDSNELIKKLEITQALSSVEKQRDDLTNSLKHIELEKQLSEKLLKDKYETQIKDRDDSIERL